MQNQRIANAMQQLLEHTRLSEGQVASRLEQARSVAYWEGLNPSPSVGRSGAEGVRETKAISPRCRKRVVEQLVANGYFEIEPLFPGPMLRRMRACIEVLKRSDWPPVFCFVHDEFWQITRVPSLVRVLSDVLGPGYRQIPHIWSFYVAATPGAAGWPPHTDRCGRANRNSRLVVWVPLSDATLDNGCMYVIPRWRIEQQFPEMETISAADAKAVLQASRALPARAGSVLGWDFRLIHCGSVCGLKGDPRVSISVEFIGAEAEPQRDELPLLDAPSDLPMFAQRIRVIARAILAYQKFEPLMIRYGELAERLSR
jgi:hypothetical protein